MIASSLGRGFCLTCADPTTGIPLVPVTSSPKRFIAIKTTWERAVREYNKDLPEEFRLSLVRRGGWPSPRVRRGGPRPKLTERDLYRIREMAKSQGSLVTVKLLTDRFNVSTRTVRRALKKAGITLQKRRAVPRSRLRRRS